MNAFLPACPANVILIGGSKFRVLSGSPNDALKITSLPEIETESSFSNERSPSHPLPEISVLAGIVTLVVTTVFEAVIVKAVSTVTVGSPVVVPLVSKMFV